MRILHFIDSEGLYGAEAVLLDLVYHQQRKGHSPAIVSIGTTPEEKPLEREARRRGLRVHSIRMQKGPDPRGALALAALADREQAEILHSHGYKTNILLGFLPRRIRRRPLLCTLHGYTHVGTFDRMRVYRWLDLKAVRRSNAAVLVHRGMLSNDGLRSLDPQSVRVIENGLADRQDGVSGTIDPIVDEFCRAARVIGAVGRLSPEKGFDRLIRAFSKIARTRPTERLLILGEGAERPRLEELIRSEGLERRVLMPGFVNARVHLPLMKLFVLPSLTEGLPICLLEAMQAGVPIVATRVGGVSAVLENGRCGALVEPDDLGGLITAITNVLTNEVLARTMIRHAQIAVRSYSSERMTERYLEAYSSIMSSADRPRSQGEPTAIGDRHSARNINP